MNISVTQERKPLFRPQNPTTEPADTPLGLMVSSFSHPKGPRMHVLAMFSTVLGYLPMPFLFQAVDN